MRLVAQRRPSFNLKPLAAGVLATALLATPLATADARPRAEASPQAAAQPEPLIIIVSLRKQRLTVYNKDGHVVDSPISSGQPDFPTPTGVFSVIGKEIEHESNIYEGAAMPFMQRLTWTGTAMHAGNLPGYPASHCCVRLPYSFSERLFGMTQINTRVIVTREDVAPQPISHAKLFAPPASDADRAPMVSALPSRVASLAVTPALADVSFTPGQLPLTAKAKARFAETAKLFEAIKPAEAARAAVWEQVKAANRALERARGDINSREAAINDAKADVETARRAKLKAEAQLAAVMRKAQTARTPDALEALAKAEDAAEARLLDLADKFDAAVAAVANLQSGLSALRETLKGAEATRRALDDGLKSANQALKDAQSSYTLAKREDARYSKPVSVLVSRKTQRLYVRQGFEPVLEVPVAIANPEQPLGTHVFTAMAVKDGKALQWNVVSFGVDDTKGRARTAAAGKALDRIEFPAEALEAISDVVKPGSSLIVSDEGHSQYFGNGTDFTVNVR